MSGLIDSDDIATVKERSSLEDIVREHVTLRRSGSRLVGLCPFHDEKSPSFGINPANGFYHCFGCGEGGDVISFVQKVENLSFTETVERLAERLGVQLRYEGGTGRPREETRGRRARLLEAHRVAEEFYTDLLLHARAARPGRDFLRARDFNGGHVKQFGIGFAPPGGDVLVRHLRAKDFADDELVVGGLAGRGSRGLYDRFRGRLVWPIRDITGDTIGFGARRIFDDDRIEAKYLNTAETPIYKKSSVLYGLDLARKKISAERRAVVVEGYTDVMACHLAGVETAVATCGTAFGAEHIKILRRLIRDEPGVAPARVVFTFDGDAAGQRAAMSAFRDDQKWASQSYVAVERSGKDPCELRQFEGGPAVVALVEDAVPMFEFAVRTTIDRFDLTTAEGRVLALRAVAPIVASIRDRSLRPEYTREVAGMLGVEVEQAAAEVSRAGRATAHAGRATVHAGPASDHEDRAERHTPTPEDVAEPEPGEGHLPMPDPRDPVVAAERQLLQVLLQFPSVLQPAAIELLTPELFSAPAHRAVLDAIRTVHAAGLPPSGRAWAAGVTEAAPTGVAGLISELAVAGLPTRMDPLTGLPASRYLDELFARVRTTGLTRRIGDAMSALRRLEHAETPDHDRSRQLAVQLQELQREVAAIKEGMS